MAQKNLSVFIILIGVLLVGGGAFYLFSQKSKARTEPTETLTALEESADGAPVTIDVAAAISERILGNPSAPIKISEHSSLTCGHCGVFHRGTFKAFKARYIDTGKAYIVFSDFPLNAPALHASMTARCLPKDKYFDFIQMLFETQDDWAYERNYIKLLQAKAESYGLSKASFKACVNNEPLQDAILNRLRAAQTQWNVASTPSFVVNNKTLIAGGHSIEEFEKAIEEGAQ